MGLRTELEALRRHLEELAHDPDDALTTRYTLKRRPFPSGLYWRLRRAAIWVYHLLQALRFNRPSPWPAALKHAPQRASAKPLLIWAVGAERDALREACRGFSRLQDTLPKFAPVLVTDVADFAFFSRLGWLVEYLPRLTGEGEPYEARKARYLARLYRGAPALPVSAGLEMAVRTEEIRRWVIRNH